MYIVKGSNKSEWEGRILHDHTGEYQFLNMRAYLYWMLRDWLNPAQKNNPALPPNENCFKNLQKPNENFGQMQKSKLSLKKN